MSVMLFPTAPSLFPSARTRVKRHSCCRPGNSLFALLQNRSRISERHATAPLHHRLHGKDCRRVFYFARERRRPASDRHPAEPRRTAFGFLQAPGPPFLFPKNPRNRIPPSSAPPPSPLP